MVLLTLREMAKGGMHDQLGGGFHRYSVDDRWFVPHFEKMLYDQAQLAISYLEAFQITGDPQYADTARRTLDYVLRDMTGPKAASTPPKTPIAPSTRRIRRSKAKAPSTSGPPRRFAPWWAQPAADWFCHRYGVEEGGNVASDPHGEFTGRNILYQAHTVEETARQFGRPAEEVRAALAAGRSASCWRPAPDACARIWTTRF